MDKSKLIGTSLCTAGLLGTLALAAPSAPVNEKTAIVPLPASIAEQTGAPGFSLKNPIITDNPALYRHMQQLGLPTSLAPDNVDLFIGPDISASTSQGTTGNQEGYTLTVTPNRITIAANSDAGIFYALTTLAQSIVKDADGNAAIPSMNITDAPRFEWRGLMVDSCRRARSVDEIKKMIDLMAHYKLNRMHWHLTDDQGWRMESKKYPKLTEIGGKRSETPIMGQRNKGDGTPYHAFYTQDQIRDIVAYAKARHITVVPEIEVPGHAAAAITAYPELGNKDIPGYNPSVVTRWGVFPYIFSPSEETFTFLDNIFAEVCELFPDSPYIHIGGDEAPKDQWKKSPFAQKIMKENGLKNEEELQSYFIRRVEKLANARGKKIIGWDEIQEGGLSPTATMMVWRDAKWALHALQQGNHVIMVPNSHYYFDYSQGAKPADPAYETINSGNLDWKRVYQSDPVIPGVIPEQEKLVLGVQGNLWSEYIPTMQKWEYQAFPRAIALAEIAWTPKEKKDIKDFETRLQKQHPYLDGKKVNFRMDDGTPRQDRNAK